jgi:hypothetical protein
MRGSRQLRQAIRTRQVILACLGELGLAACGAHGGAAPDASTIVDETFTDTAVLLPGVVIEGSWQAGANDAITIQLGTSEAGLDWDIHGHANGGTQEVSSGFAQMMIDYDFHPTQDGPWYLLLRNSSMDILRVDVRMDMYGKAHWVGWQ